MSFLREADISQTARGVAADVALNFGRGRVKGGVVGDLGFNSFTGCTENSYAGGGRVTGEASPKVLIHGQFVVGRASCGAGGGETIFQPGFGVDVMLNRWLGVRGQFDIRQLRFTDGSTWEQRFWFGISFHSK